ncbi:MAG: hypothetical protein NVS9B10_08140 [Nevskia sp.]
MNPKSPLILGKARLAVMRVFVEPSQVWFDCPACKAPLEGYLSDPRGKSEIVCEDCGAEFDIPAGAGIVIV